jgi:serpin B
MTSLKITAIFLLTGIFLLSCESENTSPKGIKEIKLSTTDNSVVNASNQLGFDMMQDLVANAEEHENLLISPLSISYALNMTHNGAEEDTKTEMGQSLNLEGIPLPDVNESYRHLTESLQNADEKVTMEIANSIWYRDTFSVEDEFIQVNQEYYDAEVSPLDFSNTEAAKETINEWVANNTHDKIDKIVEFINPLDVMFLMNAVYFKGQWKHPFNEDKTTQRSFYPRDGEMIQVPTMHIEKDFLFLENDFCTGVELPYGRGNFSMVLLLPDEGQLPEDIINNLSSDSWDAMLAEADTTEISVSLPKYKFSYKKMLNQTLKNLGMEKAFNELEANFNKIHSDTGLYISRINHKSFIDVNEEGTEAAAATSVRVTVTSMPDNIIQVSLLITI